MTFWGNIVYLCPQSFICGLSAKRKGHKGANKQHSQKNHFIIIIINIQVQLIFTDKFNDAFNKLINNSLWIRWLNTSNINLQVSFKFNSVN